MVAWEPGNAVCYCKVLIVRNSVLEESLAFPVSGIRLENGNKFPLERLIWLAVRATSILQRTGWELRQAPIVSPLWIYRIGASPDMQSPPLLKSAGARPWLINSHVHRAFHGRCGILRPEKRFSSGEEERFTLHCRPLTATLGKYYVMLQGKMQLIM